MIGATWFLKESNVGGGKEGTPSWCVNFVERSAQNMKVMEGKCNDESMENYCLRMGQAIILELVYDYCTQFPSLQIVGGKRNVCVIISYPRRSIKHSNNVEIKICCKITCVCDGNICVPVGGDMNGTKKEETMSGCGHRHARWRCKRRPAFRSASISYRNVRYIRLCVVHTYSNIHQSFFSSRCVFAAVWQPVCDRRNVFLGAATSAGKRKRARPSPCATVQPKACRRFSRCVFLDKRFLSCTCT